MLYVTVDRILEERKITRKALAEMTGLRPTAVSEICNNQRSTVNREHITAIAKALEISDVSQLFEFRN
jgi:putative transcriptional regulator